MTIADDKITALRPLTDDEALAWIQSQPGGRTDASQVDLAKRWGLSRHQVARRVASWMKRGLVRKDRTGALVATAKAAQVSEQRAQDDPPEARAAHVPPPAQSPAPEAAHSPARLHSERAAQAAGVAQEKPRVRTVEQEPRVGASNMVQDAVMLARPLTVEDAPPLAPAPDPAHPVPAPAAVRAHLLSPTPVSVRPDQVAYPISAGDILAYAVAAGLDAIAAWLGLNGFLVLFPAIPRTAILLCLVIEVAKLVAAGWLAAHWRSVGLLWRLAIVVFVAGAMVINMAGVFSTLIAAHVGDRSAQAAVERKDTEFAVTIAQQERVVADVDRRIQILDGAIEKTVALGRTKSALQMIDDQRKARAALTEERRQAIAALASLQSQRAQVTAQGRQIDAEAAPIRYFAELIGIDTGDPERLIRFFVALIVGCLDPFAVALTCAIASRRRT